MTQAYKIIVNSGYGFFGLSTRGRDGVVICEPNSHEYLQWLNTDRLININEDNGYMFCRVKKDLDVKDYNVGIAAAISSYARQKLHAIISEVKKVGGHVYYCDTDSLICNINIADYPHIQQMYQWDGDGSELGSLKNEADDYVQSLLGKLFPDDKQKQKEVFKSLVEKENGNLSWDRGCFTGCKQYGLQKKLEIDGVIHTIETVKMKGFSQKGERLTYEDMVDVSRGGKKTQKQTQFRCPKSNYVSQTNSFVIKSQLVQKSFRRVYSKGQVFQGHVLPLRL